MLWKFLVKHIFEIFIYFFNITFINGEYFVNTDDPSHVYYKFKEMKVKIFPKDIEINVILLSLSGTLFYSIDKNGNQFILTLYNEINERMKIEFGELKEFVNLESLCKWELSKYRMIKLNIQISDKISVKCNDGDKLSFNYGKLSTINNDYPILKKADNETAMIYLMNTPQHEGGYPNNDQLRGCIYDVKYNGKSLNMTASSKEIGNKCKKVCLNNICNNGECFETFSDKPICDCKLTMNNGQYCNTSFVQLNDRKLHGNKEIIRMEYIKLVLFNSSDKDLFHIKYGHFKFLIKRENSSLLAKYEDSENRFVETALSKGAYGANPSIVLMRFYAKYIYFQMFNGNLNTSISMPITRDIFYESLDSVFVSHEADMMYKTKHMQYGWCSSSLDGSGNTASKCLKFEKHLIEKKSEKKLPISAMFLKSVTELNNGISQSAFISILVIEIVFVIVFSVLIVILIKSRSKLKDRKGNNIADKMPSSAQPLIHNV